MSIVNIISAIGNNNSVYPLLVRDCGIEVPTKVVLTYNQNKDDEDVAWLATRERLVDEYTVSAVWLGGIPLLEKINAKILKNRGFNPFISTKLMKEEAEQGLEFNIKKFKNLAPEAVKDLEFLKANQAKYKKLIGSKILAETAIPIALMGFIIPKLIFAWTANTKKELAKKKEMSRNSENNDKTSLNSDIFVPKTKNMSEFANNAQGLTFGNGILSSMANLSTVQKMALTDGGYAVGRIATARKKNEAYDIGFKMAGMMFLNFVFPKYLAKFLDKTTGRAIKSNLNLDIKMLDDKEFIDAIKNKKLALPDAKTGRELLDFVDKNPDSLFVKYANKYKKVTMLENGVRDPRCYVNLDALKSFRDNIAEISQNALKSGNVEKFMKKAKIMKGVNILANVGISSFLLAYGLPKAQFAFRKLITGSELEPGIID